MCKINYLYHSGFLIELKNKYLLFDYYKGGIPAINTDKKMYIFASHHHPDHFNPEIFNIFPDSLRREYILGYDIKLRKRDGSMRYENITDIQADKAHIMRFDETLMIDDVKITTVKSTDCGVAYLIFADGKIIYHAGDLNDWCMEERDKAFNNNMTAMYRQRLEKINEILQGRSIDYAFLPLDFRLGKYYAKGINEFVESIAIKEIYPMHMWEQYEYIEKYNEEYGEEKKIHTLL